jgi:hypothetical protein
MRNKKSLLINWLPMRQLEMKEFNLLDVVGTFVAQGILGCQTTL